MTSSGIGTAALLVLLCGATVGLHAVQARNGLASPVQGTRDLLYVQSPEVAERAALSYDSVLADLYWIRAVQYFGRSSGAPGEQRDLGLLYPLLDFTTSLDPRFNIPYRFGAIFLAEPQPGGAGRPGQAIALLEKGLRAQPDKWQYAGDIGFVNYFWLRDYEAAASWFRRSARMPNGPEWMEALAATVLNEGGNRASSRRLWQDILEGESPVYLRERARRALMQLDALDQIDILERVVATYEARSGSRPASWMSMVSAGLLRGVPNDPTGVPYEFDAATGSVAPAAESSLLPLPQVERPR